VLDLVKAAPSQATGPAERRSPASAGRLRLLAIVLGLLATVAALAVPFLPVNQDVTTLRWPTALGTASVSAPLVSYAPLALDATMPCATARAVQARSSGPAVLLATTPPSSPNGQVAGMQLQAEHEQVTLIDRGSRLGTLPLPPGACSISVHSDGFGTSATVDGRQFAAVQGDHRPQVTGIYSTLGRTDDSRGVSVNIRVDTRYDSTPTALKVAAIVAAITAFAGCVAVLRRLDATAGRRPPRLTPRGWWKPTLRDTAVFSALVIWWLIGATTSDDGYILTIARARESAGYVSNYFRWFAGPEAPFGWPYELDALLVRVSTAAPWLRLPELLMAIASWLLISRQVLPRLGQKVRRSHAAGWAAAAVFLAFWLPYDNGLRPEPVVVLFSLLALCAVERAVATNRLAPAALGLVAAALAMGANPHGLAAVLPYVVAVRPLLRILRSHARHFGWFAVLAPISGCGFVILTLVYANQTWRSIVDASKLRAEIGPAEHWYQELDRYIQLFSLTPDGSLARRFPVLLVILCLVTCMMVLLRRGRIRGAALGPSRRLLGVAALSFVVLDLTPTKWPHHFGIFAAVGGALAALTALATSSTVLRSQRNRAAFFAALMVICAYSFTGTNGFWYVSGWGVPWSNQPPSLDGHQLSTVFLAIGVIAGVVALVEHLRLDWRDPNNRTRDSRTPRSEFGVEKSSRALRLGTAPLSLTCALLIIGELATFGKAIQKQGDSYSLGADNIKQLAGSSCGLSDYVGVEADPLAGVLPVATSQPGMAGPGSAGTDGESPNDTLRPVLTGGFRRVAQPAQSPGPAGPAPYGFGGDSAPVWGNWDAAATGSEQLRTQWYDLPQQAVVGQVPIVVTVAGKTVGDNTLTVEYGRDTAQGFQVLSRQPVPSGADAPQWRDVRLMVPPQARTAQKMRIVAVDNAVGPDGWMAVSAPRVPQLTRLTDFVRNSPTFIEWPAAFAHPCLQIPLISHGISELPGFRIIGSSEVRRIGKDWSSPDAGGSYGWMDITEAMRPLPTYLRGDPQRDWGELDALVPYDPNTVPAQAAMQVSTETHWGTWTPGPVSTVVPLPGAVPNLTP
jgi:arabinosyltransferase C